jgi:predicted XRE-type DNA-binding protein
MIVHIGYKTPIDFGVTRSKVNVTITLELKTVSEHNLSSIRPTGFKLDRMIVHIGKKTSIDFGVTRSKVKVTMTLKLKAVSGA